MSGTLVETVGFKTMLVGIGLVCFIYAPLLSFLKDPPVRTEQEKAEATVSPSILIQASIAVIRLALSFSNWSSTERRPA